MKKTSVTKRIALNSWNGLPLLEDFNYPWSKDHIPRTEFKTYHNNEFLFFQFKAFGPEPKIFVANNHKLEVRHSERVEIFFRTDEKMSPYYCLEIDPQGRVLDYKADYYRIFNRNWQWPDDLALNALINKDHYLIAGRFKLDTLREMKILKDQSMEIGLYRGHCIDIKDDIGEIRWSTWVDPQTPEPDFHVPNSFGRMILED